MVPAPTEQPAANKKSSTPTGKQRVLVVDDNIDAAQTIGWMIEAMGHDYTLAYDGEEALGLANSYDPSVILLDIGLPKLNGYEVGKALRQDKRFHDTLVIAETGWGQKKDRELAEQAGFDHHLVKPVDYEKRSELVNHARAATAGRTIRPDRRYRTPAFYFAAPSPSVER